MTDTTVIKIPEDFKVTNKTYSEVGKLNEVEKILEGYGMKEALYDSSFKELTKELTTLIEKTVDSLVDSLDFETFHHIEKGLGNREKNKGWNEKTRQVEQAVQSWKNKQ